MNVSTTENFFFYFQDIWPWFWYHFRVTFQKPSPWPGLWFPLLLQRTNGSKVLRRLSLLRNSPDQICWHAKKSSFMHDIHLLIKKLTKKVAAPLHIKWRNFPSGFNELLRKYCWFWDAKGLQLHWDWGHFLELKSRIISPIIPYKYIS